MTRTKNFITVKKRGNHAFLLRDGKVVMKRHIDDKYGESEISIAASKMRGIKDIRLREKIKWIFANKRR